MNPSTLDILKAIDTVKSDKVIVLPNNKNIIPAAEQAKELASKQVTIIPTRTIPQGIAALLAFNFQNDLESNANAMARAAQNIQTAEITTATRSVNLDGIDVKQGQVIGLLDGTLKVSGENTREVGFDLLKQMNTADREIVTLYFGDSISANDAESFASEIRRIFPAQEVEVVNGGQPHYQYIISVE